MVWQLPDEASYKGCVYDEAIILGNDSAGVGLGVAYTVTSKPAYMACGVFGHCEEFGQKVVIKATLGPLPANPRKAPAQIRNPYPFPPPAVSPPPLALYPPPPKVTGFLADVFNSPKAKDYSVAWSFLEQLAPSLEKASRSTPLTILVPSDDALAAVMDALNVEVTLLPTAAARGAFIANLVSYHVVTTFAKAEDIKVRSTPHCVQERQCVQPSCALHATSCWVLSPQSPPPSVG